MALHQLPVLRWQPCPCTCSGRVSPVRCGKKYITAQLRQRLAGWQRLSRNAESSGHSPAHTVCAHASGASGPAAAYRTQGADAARPAASPLQMSQHAEPPLEQAGGALGEDALPEVLQSVSDATAPFRLAGAAGSAGSGGRSEYWQACLRPKPFTGAILEAVLQSAVLPPPSSDLHTPVFWSCHVAAEAGKHTIWKLQCAACLFPAVEPGSLKPGRAVLPLICTCQPTLRSVHGANMSYWSLPAVLAVQFTVTCCGC